MEISEPHLASLRAQYCVNIFFYQNLTANKILHPVDGENVIGYFGNKSILDQNSQSWPAATDWLQILLHKNNV